MTAPGQNSDLLSSTPCTARSDPSFQRAIRPALTLQAAVPDTSFAQVSDTVNSVYTHKHPPPGPWEFKRGPHVQSTPHLWSVNAPQVALKAETRLHLREACGSPGVAPPRSSRESPPPTPL